MPDPFKKVNPGEDVVFHAETFNTFLSAGQAEKRRQLSRISQPTEDVKPGTLVKVKNESGSDLLRGSVLGISEPIFPPAVSEEAFTREVLFRGVTPTASHQGRFVILYDPIRAGGIGRAYVDGAAPVQVNVTSASHVCADVSPGDRSKLVSMAAGGSAAILWPSGLTGTLWSIVRFGTRCIPPDCDPLTTKATFNVKGCANLNLAGATVTVTGADSFSGTTNASGQFISGIIKKGSYNYTITYPTLQTVTGTFTVGVCGGNTNINAQLLTPAGRVCCGNNYTWPTTIYFTNSEGTVTLTFGITTPGYWSGVQTVSRSSWTAKFCFGTDGNSCQADYNIPASMQSVNVHWSIRCDLRRITEGWWDRNAAWKTNCNDGPGGIQGATWPVPCLPCPGCETTAGTLGGGADSVDSDIFTVGPLPKTVTGIAGSTAAPYNCPVPISGGGVLAE